MISSDQEKILRSLISEELIRLHELDIGMALDVISIIPQLAGMISDRRLKQDIVPVGLSPTGINIYEFSFEPAGQRFRGVMAQEILDSHPDAVIVSDDGFYAVEYDKIDADFEIVPLEEF